MEVNHQTTSKSIKANIKKKMSLRSFFNILGVFIFIGLALTIITDQYYINENLEIHKQPIDIKKAQEFLSFIAITSLVYYFTANVYFMGEIGKKIFYITLALISFVSISMTVILL